MAAVMPRAAHFAEDHRLDIAEILLDPGAFAPIYTGILLDWRCPHGMVASGHLHREEWQEESDRMRMVAGLWRSLQSICDGCAKLAMPVVGEVVGREGPAA